MGSRCRSNFCYVVCCAPCSWLLLCCLCAQCFWLLLCCLPVLRCLRVLSVLCCLRVLYCCVVVMCCAAGVCCVAGVCSLLSFAAFFFTCTTNPTYSQYRLCWSFHPRPVRDACYIRNAAKLLVPLDVLCNPSLYATPGVLPNYLCNSMCYALVAG